MRQLDLQQIFNREIAVPNINSHKELASVLREVEAFDSESDLAESLNELRDITGTDQVGIGIKKGTKLFSLSLFSTSRCIFTLALNISFSSFLVNNLLTIPCSASCGRGGEARRRQHGWKVCGGCVTADGCESGLDFNGWLE